ncbi:MAG: hypothetical protein JJT78_07370 [Leptospira sp.]|nr:hypothetical protein [Leptospira sp.]
MKVVFCQSFFKKCISISYSNQDVMIESNEDLGDWCGSDSYGIVVGVSGIRISGELLCNWWVPACCEAAGIKAHIRSQKMEQPQHQLFAM